VFRSDLNYFYKSYLFVLILKPLNVVVRHLLWMESFWSCNL